ncbi:MAG: GNAT family N-acetyltransferase [Sphingobacteriales bacterium]|nr:MAG: GNAT family N-acetyltransferase [Sphingobacteriales bacterium]
MLFREATLTDIPQMQVVRNSVKENALSNPALVTDNDYEIYLTEKGNGWVCIVDNTVVGFAIVDVQDNNVWALFVHPGFHKQGIGKQLHDMMLDWYFAQTKDTIWLSTAPNTRAAGFYTKAGWKQTGIYGKGELKFEMSFSDWQR